MTPNVNIMRNEDVWAALSKLLEADELKYYIENIEDMEGILVSDTVVQEESELFGGEKNILILLNALRRMRKSFETLEAALRRKEAANG